MPTQYAYHGSDHRYKSAPGASAQDIGYAYTDLKNTDEVTIWYRVAADLIDQMEAQLNISPQPVYLVPHRSKNVFINSYDHALRTELYRKGYTISSTPDHAASLYYEGFSAHHHDHSVSIDDYTDKHYKLVTFRLGFDAGSDASADQVSYVIETYLMHDHRYLNHTARYRYFNDIVDQTAPIQEDVD